MDYAQPDFYHFNQDSVWLANWVSQNHLPPIHSLLDLCAGSGVIGLEIAQKRREMQNISFVEMQKEFSFSLETNIKNFLSQTIQHHVYWQTLGEFFLESPKMSYDCIVINPPYYDQAASRVSPSLERRLCRHFIIDGHNVLLELLKLLKTENNKIYMVNDIGEMKKNNYCNVFKCLSQQGPVGIYQYL